MSSPLQRSGPRFPRLGRFCFRATRRIATWLLTPANFHANDSNFTVSRVAAIRAKLARGETVYLAGLGLPGTPDPGAALVEVTQAHGARLITSENEKSLLDVRPYPRQSLDVMRAALRAIDRNISDIDAWLTTWDYPDLAGTLMRSFVENFPDGFTLLRANNAVSLDARRFMQMIRTPIILREQFGLAQNVSLLMMPHHDNQAWFGFASSGFGDDEPVAIAVLDVAGDLGSVSTYIVQRGVMTKLFCNDSLVETPHDLDALTNIVDGLLRATDAHRLVLTGAVGRNATLQEKLRDHFNADWFTREQNRDAALHLFAPEHAGTTIGAALLFARIGGAQPGS